MPSPTARTRSRARAAARLAAVQALYQHEMEATPIPKLLHEFHQHRLGATIEGVEYADADAAFFDDVVKGVDARREEIDRLIAARLASEWSFDRLDKPMRQILRAGTYELLARADVPTGAVISEYLDVTDAFYDKREKGFVNGLLDAVAKEVRGLTEAEFIAALRALPLHPGARELRDDAAVLELGGATLVLTHDMIAEGVHYLAGTDPADIAWKLVAVNLSDLAAKGAEPIGVLIGASLTEGSERFVEGLREVLTAHRVPLLGGDTIAPSGGAVFGCTAIGRASGPVPARSGAKPGDLLWVTGTIGAAMLGFEAMKRGEAAQAYLRPTPRLAEGRALAPHVHAMMDVSDGLLLDARRIAEASGCTIEINLSAIPFAAGLDPSRRREAASWGDDYELLFAAAPGFTPPVAATRIGAVLAQGNEPLLLDGAPSPGSLGYEHR